MTMKTASKGPQLTKRRPSRGRDAIIVGVGFAILAALFLLIVVPTVAKDAGVAGSALVESKVEFEDVSEGRDVVVYGELSGNPEIVDEEIAEGAILVVQDELRRTTNGSESDWDWVEIRREVPLLVLSMNGGSIVLTTDSGPVNLRGNVDEALHAGTGAGLADTFPYQDQRIGELSTRTFTLQNGNMVTALGTKAGENELAIRELFAGEPDQLVAELQKGAMIFTWAAWCFLAFSGFAIGLGVIAALRGRF
jgi:hypothetical protein